MERSGGERLCGVVIHDERVFRYIVMNQNAIYVYSYGNLLRLSISTYVVGSLLDFVNSNIHRLC